MNTLQKVLVAVSVIIILVGGWYVLKNPRTQSPEKQQTLEVIKEIIITQKDCKTTLPKLANFLKENPRYAEAWQFLGVCQFQTGDWTAAKISFEKALVLDPEMDAPENYLKIINSGVKPVKREAKP